MTRPQHPAHLFALVGLLLILTALTVPRLGESIWTDEQRTLHYIGVPPVNGPTTLGESLERLAENYWQSPGYFVLMWGWWRMMGADVFTLRLPSLYIGLLAVALTYHLWRRLVSPAVGLYAAAFTGLSAFYINFLHDMRTYALLVLATLMTVWAYRWALRDSPGWRWGGVLTALGAALMLYAHFFAAFPLAILGLYHLLTQRRNRAFWPLLGAFVVAGLLFSAWLPVLLGGLVRSTEDPRRIANMGFWGGLYETLYLFANGGVLLVALLVGVGQWRASRPARIAALGLAVCYGLLWGVTRFFQAFTEVKYVLYFWPWLAGLAALGVARLHTHGIHPAWFLALWGVGLGTSLTSPTEQARIHPWSIPPLAELTDALAGLTTDDDALLFLAPPTTRPPDIEPAMLGYYAHGLPLRRTAIVNDTRATTDTFWAAQVAEGARGADRVLVAYETPLATWRLGPLEQAIMPGLAYSACGVAVQREDVTVVVYGRPWARTPYGFRLPDDAVIEFTPYAPPTIGPDGHLHVSVTWDFPDPDITAALPIAYSVGVHIETAAGTFVQGVDSGITAHDGGCAHHVLPVNGLPPGDYVVRATIYRWETGERLPSITPAPDGERPEIGSFTVR